MAVTSVNEAFGAAHSLTPPTSITSPAARVAQELRHRACSPAILMGLARLADALGLAVIGTVIFTYYVYPVEGLEPAFLLALAAMPIAAVASIGSAGGYTLTAYRKLPVHIGRAIVVWALVFGALILTLFFLKRGEDFSRLWLATWFAGGSAVLLGSRLGFGSLVSQWTADGLLERRAVLVGGGAEAVELIRALREEPDNDIRICGIFDDRDDSRVPALAEGLPKLGRIDELLEFGRKAEIDMLIVALPMTAENRLVQMLKKLWVLPIDIRLSARSSQIRFRPRSYSYVGSVPFLDLYDKPVADWDFVRKWVFDRILGSLLLIAAAPVMLAVALAVKLDSKGPALFKQRRYGFNNELIEVYKFRSMYTEMADAKADRLVTKGDPRVTRVGRFIRKTSLDELPQLFNVAIFGNLSLVGPRPHAVHAKAADQLYEQVVDGYFARHRVKPGVTGWAQINGWRGETDTSEKLQRRVEHDLSYIENWSVLFDLYILALTPFRLLNTDSAY